MSVSAAISGPSIKLGAPRERPEGGQLASRRASTIHTSCARIPAAMSHLLLEESDILTVEDPQGLLKRLDLLLAASDALLVRDTGIHARRLQLVVVGKSRVELLLRALLVRLLRRLVLHVLGVRSAVHRRLAAELVERALRLSLRGLGVRLETREVRGDHLQHAEHTAVLRLHAGVGLVEDLRLLLVLLDQRRGLAGLLVELLQDRHRLGHGGLRLLRVLDRL